jgi:hypothetical protein
MARHKIVDQVQNTVGLYTSMSTPWDQTHAEPQAEAVPEANTTDKLRPAASPIAAALAFWLTSLKSILPEGWF